VPTGLSSAWYDGGVSAGDTVTDYVVDNTFTLTSPSPTTEFYNGMYNAPGGTLQLYAGVTSLDSIFKTEEDWPRAKKLSLEKEVL
jgi:hypothetical protein